MTDILRRYRIVIFVVLLILAALLLWIIFNNQSVKKVPSRGVFVITDCIPEKLSEVLINE